MFRIWHEVEGCGPEKRGEWFNGLDGQPEQFSSREEAQQRADAYLEIMRGSHAMPGVRHRCTIKEAP